jgi:hypothetical protein
MTTAQRPAVMIRPVLCRQQAERKDAMAVRLDRAPQPPRLPYGQPQRLRCFRKARRSSRSTTFHRFHCLWRIQSIPPFCPEGADIFTAPRAPVGRVTIAPVLGCGAHASLLHRGASE